MTTALEDLRALKEDRLVSGYFRAKLQPIIEKLEREQRECICYPDMTCPIHGHVSTSREAKP